MAVHNPIEIGSKFGMLTVIKHLGRKSEKNRSHQYLCKCDCGNEIIAYGSKLRNGKTSSCYCVIRKKMHDFRYKGSNEFPELQKKWDDMKYRCNNKNDKMYYRYGARGIKVCDEWANDFIAFKKWSLENGWTPGCNLQIDRINNDGDYEPSNCRYVTKMDNCNNRKTSHFITAYGITDTVANTARKYNVDYDKLYYLIHTRKKTAESALRKLGVPDGNISA